MNPGQATFRAIPRISVSGSSVLLHIIKMLSLDAPRSVQVLRLLHDLNVPVFDASGSAPSLAALVAAAGDVALLRRLVSEFDADVHGTTSDGAASWTFRAILPCDWCALVAGSSLLRHLGKLLQRSHTCVQFVIDVIAAICSKHVSGNTA